VYLDEVPAAFQALAVQLEIETPLLVATLGIPDRLPASSIPQHDGTAAIFASGNGAFEVAVGERMILDMHGEALVRRIEAWALCDGPALECAFQFQTEVVVQPAGSMLLDQIGATRRRDRRIASWLAGLREVPLGPILGKLARRHG